MPRHSPLLALLPLLTTAARAQDGAPPDPSASGVVVPWWLWIAMVVPPIFLITAGTVATRWFDARRGQPEAGEGQPR